ncbi:MAG: hypothetical protein RL173_3503 [Fibrobacterota bacterium]|jgi:uncharacterized protein (DUF2141 family)
MLEAILLAGTLVAAAGPELGQKMSSLALRVDGFPDARGKATLRIYDSVRSMETDPARFEWKTDVVDGVATFVAEGLPQGRWAVMVFHDRNTNGKVDHGWNRFPTESIGYSNGFEPSFRAGMPSYHKVAIRVDASTDSLRLTVRPIDLSSFLGRRSK